MTKMRVGRIATIFVALAFFLIRVSEAFAAGPMSTAQLALYQGTDREKILIEGAKREGQFTLYTSHTWFRTFVKEFEKKYPFIKASEWRNDSKNLIRKVFEESKSGRFLVDVVETTTDGMRIMKREGLFQEYFSPRRASIRTNSSRKEKTGSFICPTAKPTIVWDSTPSLFRRPRRRELSRICLTRNGKAKWPSPALRQACAG